jgi:hypothetical protein
MTKDVLCMALVLQDALRQQRDAAQKWVAQESKELALAAQAHLEGNVVNLRYDVAQCNYTRQQWPHVFQYNYYDIVLAARVRRFQIDRVVKALS